VQAYLDHAATTPLRPEARAAMEPFLGDRFGNPSGSHALARDARRAVDEARATVAAVSGRDPGEVVFTANGTEAANLAVLGVRGLGPGGIVCSAVEHHAVLRATLAAGGSTLPVHSDGALDLDALVQALHPGVGLVALMAANNEVGTLQPLAEAVERVRRHSPDAAVLVDAVAAVPALDPAELVFADLLMLSAHKFGGPKGAGALLVRDGTRLAPVLHGGSQERDRRPGTHDVAGIVGMAAALVTACERRDAENARLRGLRDRLVEGLLEAVPGAVEHGGSRSQVPPCRLPGVASMGFPGVENEELLLVLDDQGVMASAGAACASGAGEPSHVLLAMGLAPAEARAAVRFSLGHTSDAADVDHALSVVPAAVRRLLSSPPRSASEWASSPPYAWRS
jgi:cysteine desulfurase